MPKVIKRFKDKDTLEVYPIGSEYEGSDSRTLELYNKGYLDKKTIQKKEVVILKPKHVGGGWYELPNGDRIRGKDKALKALGSGE